MATYAIFSARYAPLVGGVETYTANLARELASQGNRVVIVTCALTQDPEHEVLSDGVELYRVPAASPLGPRLPIARMNKYAREIYDQLEGIGIDRVVINTRFYKLSIHGLKFARRINAPALVIDHGSAYLTMGNAFLDFFIRLYEHYMTAKVKRFNPQFAGVSTKSAQWLSTFGIQTHKVVPNAIDAIAFSAQASNRNFREELGIPTDVYLVSSVGRLTPEKGPEYLLKVADILEDCHFVWAGEGPSRETLQKAGNQRIHLIGNTLHNDLAALFSQSDAFFLPTRSEGFCTSLLEACAMGALPVMPNVGGVAEVMGDPARFGAVVNLANVEDTANAIHEVVTLGEESREILKEQLVEHIVKDCSWTQSVHELQNIFDETIE